MEFPVSVHSIAKVRSVVKKGKPTVQCIVPPIAGLRTLDFLMASGATPVETEYPDEARAFAQFANSLVVSLQNLSPDREAAAKTAISTIGARLRPWVLHPSYVDHVPIRMSTVKALAAIQKPAVIVGDYRELIALSGGDLGEGDYKAAVRALAKEYNCVVASMGEIDYIADAERDIGMRYNNELFKRAAGTETFIAGLIAAFCAVEGDYLIAAASAISLVRVAGELAAAQSVGIGSFMTKMQDEIEIVETSALIDCIEIAP